MPLTCGEICSNYRATPSTSKMDGHAIAILKFQRHKEFCHSQHLPTDPLRSHLVTVHLIAGEDIWRQPWAYQRCSLVGVCISLCSEGWRWGGRGEGMEREGEGGGRERGRERERLIVNVCTSGNSVGKPSPCTQFPLHKG